jgi:hypothetical protein
VPNEEPKEEPKEIKKEPNKGPEELNEEDYRAGAIIMYISLCIERRR